MTTRPKRPMTFPCEYCGREVTEEHGPGPRPRYCAACAAEAQRSLNRQRVRRFRERTALPWWAKRPVGRPKKG